MSESRNTATHMPEIWYLIGGGTQRELWRDCVPKKLVRVLEPSQDKVHIEYMARPSHGLHHGAVMEPHMPDRWANDISHPFRMLPSPCQHPNYTD